MSDTSLGQRLAESVTLTLAARAFMVATPVVLGVFVWVVADMIGTNREAMDAIDARVTAITHDLAEDRNRITAIEASRAVASKAADGTRAQLTLALTDLAKEVSGQRADIAALTATVGGLKDQINARRLGMN